MSTTRDRLTTALADRYTLDRELGAGGMATVYLAQDIRHHRQVAIKVLRPELAAVIGADRFLSEIRTTANLQHPHILPLFDSGAADSFLFYVMPFVEGESLRDRLDREQQLPIGDAVRIAEEVASALDYAHRHGVIHRDIKPENIMLHDGRALVADFGIALAASSAGTRMTETGMSLGTPHYMSPEQAMGERTLDARTDVYALGCVLYEMLTGETPFDGPSAQSIIAKVMTERPTPPTATRDTVPDHVEDAVLQALAKLPVDRFASAAGFAAALGGAANRTAHRRSSRHGAPPATRDSRIVIALAVLAAVLAMIAAFGWMRSPDDTTNDTAALAYQVHLTPTESDGGFVATQLALSRDGSVVVYSDTVGGTRQLWLKDRSVAEARPIPGTTNGQAPFLSPDGRSVAYTAGGQLLRIPLTGGAPVVLSDSAAFVSARRGAWLDDGTIVFVGGQNSFLFTVPDTGGVSRRISTTDQLYGYPAIIAPVPGRSAVVVTACDFTGCTNPVVSLLQLDPLSFNRVLPGSSGAWPLTGNRLLNILPDGSVFLADFDPVSGQVGDGSPIFSGVAMGYQGPELAVGGDGVTLQASGGAGTFSNLTRLVAAGFDGSTRVIDSAWTGIFANNSRLDLSPDGRRLLLSLVDPDGVRTSLATKPFPTGATTLFSTMGVQSARGVWSPDGRRIAWVMVGENGIGEIWHQAADGSGAPAILASDPRGLYEISFSPDGKWLLYRTDDVAAGQGNIYARRTAGDTASIVIAASDVEETSATVSPDGRWVAYAARLGDTKEIVVRPFPNVDAGRVQVSSGGGTEPLWSRDSRTLYYRHAERGQIIAATMEAEGAFPLSGRSIVHQAPVFELWDNNDTRHYSLLPDGTGFLMMQRIRSTADSTRIRLILRERIVPDR